MVDLAPGPTPSAPAPTPRVATLAFDGWSGFFDLAKAEQQPTIDEETPTEEKKKGQWGNWGFDYNKLAGRAQHMLRLMEQIRLKHKINLVLTAHLAAEKLYIEKIGRDGVSTNEGKQVAWKVDLPGQMQEQILRPFDEVWHLQIQPNAAGKPPTRLLMTEAHLWSGGAGGASAGFAGFPFEAKTREGVRGPITNPTYASIVAALPQGGVMPTRILVVGIAGAGKTTLIATWPKPIVYVDMWGGAERVTRQEGLTMYTPSSVADTYRVLMKIRDTGSV
jgi:hypothetical protein